MENNELKNLITIKPQITEEEFQLINKLLLSEEKKWLSFYYGDASGIFFDNRIVGLFKTGNFMGKNLEIQIYLMKECRGKGIAQAALEKIIDIYGKEHPEKEKFMLVVDPNNKASIKSALKGNWIQTFEYDEVMQEEGGTFYYLFQKNNPHYDKEKVV